MLLGGPSPDPANTCPSAMLAELLSQTRSPLSQSDTPSLSGVSRRHSEMSFLEGQKEPTVRLLIFECTLLENFIFPFQEIYLQITYVTLPLKSRLHRLKPSLPDFLEAECRLHISTFLKQKANTLPWQFLQLRNSGPSFTLLLSLPSLTQTQRFLPCFSAKQFSPFLCLPPNSVLSLPL